MTTPEFYRLQAAEARSEAAASSLPNVRDRCERSAKVWLDMADRLERSEGFKSRNAPQGG